MAHHGQRTKTSLVFTCALLVLPALYCARCEVCTAVLPLGDQCLTLRRRYSPDSVTSQKTGIVICFIYGTFGCGSAWVKRHTSSRSQETAERRNAGGKAVWRQVMGSAVLGGCQQMLCENLSNGTSVILL
jgi:hypothetical protein